MTPTSCVELPNGYRDSARILMSVRAILLGSALALPVLWLNVGFYTTRFAEDNRVVCFIKKYPALQIRFENIFLADQDEKALDRLSDEERRVVIEYCKYRLGIATELNTQDELNACKTM